MPQIGTPSTTWVGVQLSEIEHLFRGPAGAVENSRAVAKMGEDLDGHLNVDDWAIGEAGPRPRAVQYWGWRHPRVIAFVRTPPGECNGKIADALGEFVSAMSEGDLLPSACVLSGMRVLRSGGLVHQVPVAWDEDSTLTETATFQAMRTLASAVRNASVEECTVLFVWVPEERTGG